ncbi:MAG: exopolysaccharide biosynthesis polyprenyl glycosylphosphotransferase [Kiritimatiellae bacterium]|nr:exopolysaccharide biosynthesis polyprenyl glycosylphosphotransferase [Kiritimatiellia bacterium]
MISRKPFRYVQAFYVVSDVLAIIAAYYATVFLRFHTVWGVRFYTFVNVLLDVRETGVLAEQFLHFYLSSAPRIILQLSAILCFLYSYREMYHGRRYIRERNDAWHVYVANFCALFIIYAYFYLRRNVFHPRSIFATVIVLNVFFCLGFRRLLRAGLASARTRLGLDQCPAVLVGDSELAQFIRALIDARQPHGIHIAAGITRDADEAFDTFFGRLRRTVQEHGAHMILLADTQFCVSEIMQVLELSDQLGVGAKILTDKMEVVVGAARIPSDMIQGIPFVHFPPPTTSALFPTLKRTVSVAAAVVTLVLLAPVLALIAVLIRLTSKGPVFFVQERIGFNRRLFKMYKFRTMYDRKDEVHAQMEELYSSPGLFKMKEDPRITPVGRFLRRYSLDELPQLFNVIRGDMTLVGPRPLPQRDLGNYYEEWHYSRHGGLPGLTCLWQVSGRSELDFHNMCLLDIYYLRNQSLMLDFKILLRTVRVVLLAKGAY